MEVRFLGFDQEQNSRVYRFDVHTDGRFSKHVRITADMTIFRDHDVAIQEGPLLCGKKLTADLERGWEGEHELTAADVRAFAVAKAQADAQRAGNRKPPRGRREPADEATRSTSWRNFNV